MSPLEFRKTMDDDKALQSKSSDIEEVLVAASSFVELVKPHLSAGGSGIKIWSDQLLAALSKAMPYLEAMARLNWDEVEKRLSEAPVRSKEAMAAAALQGWHFSWLGSVAGTLDLIESLTGATVETIDEVMVSHYRENLDWYVKELVAKYPHRASPIEAAARAHKVSEEWGFLLSVPVFLAQADGVFGELSQQHMPLGKEGRSGKVKGSIWLEQTLAGDIPALDLVDPIVGLHQLDILKNKSQREVEDGERYFDALNRHQVMHGEISDYGTEINSFKAFSLLVAIALHVPEVLLSARSKTLP
jgi:hypothetical protein